jgi:hypothetical protein
MVYGGAINGVGLTNPNAYKLGGGVVYSVMGIPNGRQAANGLQPVRITQVGVYAGGRNGAITANVTVGTGQTGNFAMPGGGGGTYNVYGLGAAPAYFPGTQQTTLAINTDGSLNYGRGSIGGVNIYEGGSLAWSDATLVGDYWYEQVPAAPTMLSATPGPGGTITVQFGGSGDTGDAPITGWFLQYATNPQFNGATTINSSGTSTITGQPGTTYWFRAAGRNNVADAFGTSGPWSGAISALARSGGQIRVGNAWRPSLTKVRVGGSWRDVVVKVRSGGAWKDVQ